MKRRIARIERIVGTTPEDPRYIDIVFIDKTTGEEVFSGQMPINRAAQIKDRGKRKIAHKET